MDARSLVILYICFSVSASIVGYFSSTGVFVFGNYTGTTDTPQAINARFNLGLRFDPASIITGIIGVLGLAAIGIYFNTAGFMVILGILVFIANMFLGIFQWIVSGFPNMLNFLLAGTGLEDGTGNMWLPTIINTFVLVIFFFYLASLLAQRGESG